MGLAAAVLFAAPASAQTTSGPPTLSLSGGLLIDQPLTRTETAPPANEPSLVPLLARDKKVTGFLRSDTLLQAPADNADFSGSITTQHFTIDAGWVYNVFENHEAELYYGLENVFYDFKGAPAIFNGADDPVDYVFKHKFVLDWMTDFDDNTEINWGTQMILSMEPSADIEDSTYARAKYAMRWKVTDSLKLGLGLGFQSRLEESPILYPFPWIEWYISDDLRLNTEEREWQLNWLARDDTTLRTFGRVRFDEYRLGDPNGPRVDNILLDFGVELGGGIEVRPVPNAIIRAEIGITQGRQIELQTRAGSQIVVGDVDPAGFYALTLRYEF